MKWVLPGKLAFDREKWRVFINANWFVALCVTVVIMTLATCEDFFWRAAWMLVAMLNQELDCHQPFLFICLVLFCWAGLVGLPVYRISKRIVDLFDRLFK